MLRQSIYKFELGRLNNVPVKIEMHRDAQVLTVDFDPNTGQFCAWAIITEDSVLDQDQDWEDRTFYIAGTGHNLNAGLNGDEVMDHYGTFYVLPKSSAIVGWFHAFEVKPAGPEA